MSDADPNNEPAPPAEQGEPASAPGTTHGPADNGVAAPASATSSAPLSPDAGTKSHRSRGWIILTVLLLLGLIGVGAWALSLRSDNEDKDSTIASQQQQLDEQQGAADQAQEAVGDAAGKLQQALSGLGDQLDQLQGTADQTQEDTQAAIDQAETAADDARARAEGASDDVDKAKAEGEAAKADAEATGACARGYLSAIAGAFDAASLEDGVAQARSDIEALSGSCNGLLG